MTDRTRKGEEDGQGVRTQTGVMAATATSHHRRGERTSVTESLKDTDRTRPADSDRALLAGALALDGDDERLFIGAASA